ncbi:MAG: cyclic nucleotide-binding domain-containing protein [Deltaproteobacteria bacterium]|nr:cyclic nucleotide-binding domain-containing protein [Deltaproteobacteria bacterium]
MENTTVLKGNLKFLNLGDIMQLLGSNGSSGILRIHSPYSPEPGVVYIEKGNPINASAGVLAGLDGLYSLFGWTEGEFEFSEERISVEKAINRSRMGIILDSLKMLDDGDIVRLGQETSRGDSQGEIIDDSGLPRISGPMVDYTYVVDEEGFYDGETIIEEGKHGNWIWVILEGVIEIIKETPKGPLSIIRVSNGSFVGSLSSFLVKDHARNASARSVGNVQLGVLDSQRLSQEYARMSPEFRAIIMSLDKRLKQVTNRVVAYHNKGIDIEAFIKDRQKVMRQGDVENRLFRIQRGIVNIVQQDNDRYLPLVSLGRDDYFGAFPFIDMGHEPGKAAVLASKDLKVVSVDADECQAEYESISSTFKNIIENVATCISVTTGVAQRMQSKG